MEKPQQCRIVAHQQGMVAKIATMPLLPPSGQHVGEAAADTETVIAGGGAAQGHATRTGHCTGLPGRLADGRADASTEASQWRRDRNAASHRGIDTIGHRARGCVAR